MYINAKQIFMYEQKYILELIEWINIFIIGKRCPRKCSHFSELKEDEILFFYTGDFMKKVLTATFALDGY